MEQQQGFFSCFKGAAWFGHNVCPQAPPVFLLGRLAVTAQETFPDLKKVNG